jgi:hypothetical protein
MLVSHSCWRAHLKHPGQGVGRMENEKQLQQRQQQEEAWEVVE